MSHLIIVGQKYIYFSIVWSSKVGQINNYGSFRVGYLTHKRLMQVREEPPNPQQNGSARAWLQMKMVGGLSILIDNALELEWLWKQSGHAAERPCGRVSEKRTCVSLQVWNNRQLQCKLSRQKSRHGLQHYTTV